MVMAAIRPKCEPFPLIRVYRETIRKCGGGAPCDTTTNISTNSRFFRDDEQAASGIPVRNAGEAWHAGRPRRQAAGREARAERPLPLRFRQALQEVLSQERAILMA